MVHFANLHDRAGRIIGCACGAPFFHGDVKSRCAAGAPYCIIQSSPRVRASRLPGLRNWLARGLLWLAWDFFVFGIAWSIGWPIWRALTFGRFPHVDFREHDDAGFVEILLVCGAGLGVLAGAVWWLSHHVVG